MIFTNQAYIYNLNIKKPVWNVPIPTVAFLNDDNTTTELENNTAIMLLPINTIRIKITNFDKRLNYLVRIQNNGIFSMSYNDKTGIITVEEKYKGNALTKAIITIIADHDIAKTPVQYKFFVEKQQASQP